MKGKINYTIDEELIPLIKEEAKKDKRSESFIVNEVLLKHFKVKNETR